MRQGITPVVAIALLLGMTVAASAGAYTFISSAQQQAQEDATNSLATTVEARAVTCGRGLVDIALKNIGSTAVSTAEADLFVYQDGDLHAARTGIDLSGYTLGPGDLIRPRLFVPDVLAEGVRYTVELVLPDDVTIGSTCEGSGSVGAAATWTFDGFMNGTATDTAGSNDATFEGETFHHGTLGTSAADSPDDPVRVDGRYGGGMEFPGGNTTASQIEVPWNSEFALTGEFTVSCWMFSHGTQDNNGGSCIWNGDDEGWALEPRNNVVRVNIGGEYTVLTANLPHDEWHHFTLVYDNVTANGEARLYRDGVLQDSTTGVERPEYGADDLWIGRRSQHHRYSFDGVLDEVRVWDRALNGSEINASMNSHWPVGDPVASWSFEDGAGQVAHDTHEKVAGKDGGAVTFDGTDDALGAGSGTALDIQENLTITAWVNKHGVGDQYMGIVDKGMFTAGNDREAWGFATQPNGAFIWRAPWTHYTGDTVPDDTWTHVAVTVSNATQQGTFYMDGEPIYTFTGRIKSRPGRAVTIGALTRKNSGNSFFNGTIDEVQVYPYAVH